MQALPQADAGAVFEGDSEKVREEGGGDEGVGEGDGGAAYEVYVAGRGGGGELFDVYEDWT